MVCLLSIACGKELRVEVVDEDGKPVENAQVIVSYVSAGPADRVKGKTNKKGVFISQGDAPSMRIELEITKDGYYKSRFQHKYGNALPKDTEGTYKLILRKINNPVPMFAKAVDVLLPSLKQEYGFDFEVGDLVEPHGRGVHSDVYFWIDKSVRSVFDYEISLKVRFPEEMNGILVDKTRIPGSVYLSASKADKDALYKSTLDFYRSRGKQGKMGGLSKNNYIFRVRSEIMESSAIQSNYGRIVGGINAVSAVDKPGKAAVRFAYYFNPKTDSISLEFKRKANLFKNLKRMEHIIHP